MGDYFRNQHLTRHTRLLLLGLCLNLILQANPGVFGQTSQPRTDPETQRLLDRIHAQRENDRLQGEVALEDWLSEEFVVIDIPSHLNPGDTGRISISLRQRPDPRPVMLGGPPKVSGLPPSSPSVATEIKLPVTFEAARWDTRVRAKLYSDDQALEISSFYDEYQTIGGNRWVWNVKPRESRIYKLRLVFSQVTSDGKEKEVLNADKLSLNGKADVYFNLGRVSSAVYLALLFGLAALYVLWLARRRGRFASKKFDKVVGGFVESVGNVEVTGDSTYRSES